MNLLNFQFRIQALIEGGIIEFYKKKYMVKE